MASGKPIVATERTVEGIEDVVYVKTETPEVADKIIKILNGEIRMNLSSNIKVIEKSHIPKVAAGKLLDINK